MDDFASTGLLQVHHKAALTPIACLEDLPVAGNKRQRYVSPARRLVAQL